MANLTKPTYDVDNIQSLSDTPNETEGLTADQLKEKFDKTGADSKAYLEDLCDELDAMIAQLSPTAMITPYAGTTAPDGWLMCDGSAVSRTTYGALFAKIGTTWGSGDGSTTFNVPNLKGKVVVGVNSAETEFDTLGETGGSKYTEAHSHTGIFNGAIELKAGLLFSSNIQATGLNPNGTASVTTGTFGTGNAGNLQPYMALNYIIKY
jgi:microcystin-dependent protein